MDYKQHKENLRGQIKNKVERKLYNKRIRAEVINVDTSEGQLTIPTVVGQSEQLPCGDCENYAEWDNSIRWCSVCGTKLS